MSLDLGIGTLKNFQQQLTQRLQSAQRTHQSESCYLACRTDTQRWLFELAHTEQILAGEVPMPVPFTRPWFKGLVNFRSQLIGVIDLDVFAGAEPMPWQTNDRVLLLSSALPIRCGIRITQTTSVIDRTHLSPVTPSPALTSHQPSWVTQTFTDANGQSYYCVDLVALMALPAFLDIAQLPA